MQRSVRAGNETITYELVQTTRRSTELRVLPDGLRVFAPRGCSLRQIDSFVASRSDWIRAARERLAAYARREQARFPMTEGTTVPVEGCQLVLALEHAPKSSVRIENGRLLAAGPDTSPEAVKEQVRLFLIGLAKTRISERLNHYVPLIGRAPAHVTVREQRTKWGSCSSQHNLNFNWKLIMAPPEALDYVVIHELCHLYEFNHSEQFWARVRRYQPDCAVWRDFLRSGWSHPFN